MDTYRERSGPPSKAAASLWIRDATVIPMTPTPATVLHGTDICIEGDTIAHIQPTGQRIPPHARVIEGHHRLVLPGLVNCHTHIDMSIFRGTGEGAHLMAWLALVTQAQTGMQEDDNYWATLLSMLEFTRHGITTFADMTMSWESVPRAVAESGLRAVLHQGLIDAWPHWVEKWGDGQTQIRRAARVYGEWHGAEEGRIQVGLGPHSPYGATELLLRSAATRALEWGTSLHVHLAESEDEVRQIQETYGLTPAEYLASVGLFDAPTLAAHAIHLTETDQQILKDHVVTVAHNPASNLKLHSGLAPVASLRERGVIVGLGTDGPGSNDLTDIFREAYLVAVQQPWPEEVAPSQEALAMATLGGARALRVEDRIGTIEPGKQADLILMNLDTPCLTPGNDWPKTLVYAGSGSDVETVIVAGQVLMERGEFLILDEERILAENRARARRLFGTDAPADD